MTDLDALIEAFPHDASARRELVAFRADQDPEASLDANVEWLMFSAIDGGAVADVYEWADAVCDAAFARKWDRKDRFDGFPAVLGEALTKLWRGARRRKNPYFRGLARPNPYRQALPALVQTILEEQGDEHLLDDVLKALSSGYSTDLEVRAAMRRVMSDPRWIRRTRA